MLCRSQARGASWLASSSRRFSLSSNAVVVEKMLPDEAAPYEKTTPIVFLRGPWHSSWAWHSTMKRLSAKGFESYAVGSHAVGSDAAASDRASVPLGSIEDEMAVLVKSMPQLSSPPVLIGHGLGALLAQKYLESYAGIALVLVAPFPPDPRAAIDLLTFDHAFSPSTLEQHAQSVQSEPDPTHLKVDAARPETALNLEPLADFLEGVLVVTTGNDPVISANDVGALMRSHNIHDKNEGLASFISAPGSGGHLSMADPAWEAPGGLSDQLAAWIEEKF